MTLSSGQHRSGLTVKMMGCLLQTDNCEKQDECVETKQEDTGRGRHLFCCCRGSYCNQEFRWKPILATDVDGDSAIASSSSELNGSSTDGTERSPSAILWVFLYTVIPLLAIVVGLVIWYVYRKRKAARNYLGHVDTINADTLDTPLSPQTSEKPDVSIPFYIINNFM